MMATTTVTGHGRRASMRQTDLQTPLKSSQPTSSPIDQFPPYEETLDSAIGNGRPNPSPSVKYAANDTWEPRKSAFYSRDYANGSIRNPKQRPRKSISEAITTIRTRNGSMSANAHEIAEALRAPVSYRLIGLCVIWYLTSALTNTSSKSILNALPMPITLTIIQFAFVSIWCLLLVYISTFFPSLKKSIPVLKHGIRYPSRDVISTALPLAVFQLAGHILSSMATSQIPVSLVHTIKGLSPLFTVLAYRVVFRIRYARATYLSLIPLTLGVMLACSTGVSSNFFGIVCAFFAAIVFVSQNIFSKKLFNEADRAETDAVPNPARRKLDKLNLLCYCSGLAFFLTLPIWFVSEGYPLVSDFIHDGVISLSGKQGSLDHGALAIEFVFNGVSHFAQNILAFVLLSMVSPVSYSVASLVKRVFVIVAAILWFGSSTTPIQAVGIGLTFLGLYLYDRNSHDDVADKRANADHFRARESILPTNARQSNKPWDSNGYSFPGPRSFESFSSNAHVTQSSKKEDDGPGRVRPRGASTSRTWLPGTKQESTWQPTDSAPASAI
ncbi:hypothetical protein N7478_011308 [Penicillium angulare]|uniref:uncharacterized protein n=1 Tax=Penicillium angulare TaxID=116970 RepID=UPI0025414FBE|nr:uncharacterized protein N7478_011308 [Penicillium angulare]KAJ5263703.1 hypothetical protein N7478_011308 [Penicillium angulare]